MIGILQEAAGLTDVLGESAFDNFDEYLIESDSITKEEVIAIMEAAIIEEKNDFQSLNARGTEKWRAAEKQYKAAVKAANSEFVAAKKGASAKEVAKLRKDLEAKLHKLAVMDKKKGDEINRWVGKGEKLANNSKKGIIDKAKLLWMKTKNPKLKAAGLAVAGTAAVGGGTYAAMKARKR